MSSWKKWEKRTKVSSFFALWLTLHRQLSLFFTALKTQVEKRDKELEKQGLELQETKTTCETLKKALRKKEKEAEEKDKEIASLNQVTLFRLSWASPLSKSI